MSLGRPGCRGAAPCAVEPVRCPASSREKTLSESVARDGCAHRPGGPPTAGSALAPRPTLEARRAAMCTSAAILSAFHAARHPEPRPPRYGPCLPVHRHRRRGGRPHLDLRERSSVADGSDGLSFGPEGPVFWSTHSTGRRAVRGNRRHAATARSSSLRGEDAGEARVRWAQPLGCRIQQRPEQGTETWHACTFIAGRPVRQLQDMIRAPTDRTSQQNPRKGLIRLNQIMRGWANYFKHAVREAALSPWPAACDGADGHPVPLQRQHDPHPLDSPNHA
ncbi:group II intron maturase-specific domain-containing protein [Streptomyces mirabilis]|uniref:group II intron maturase-specific domain-containing protein n=2 Tax=Streptomyces mirabilis TaxID=68239 RepID=UPI0033339B2E